MRYVPPTIGLQCRRVLLRRSLQASLLVCVGVLVGCASRPNVPQAQRIVVPEFYIVQRGDTLGGIAARFGLDYRELGRANQVDNNYTIYADQRLRLRGLNQPPRVRILTPQGSTTSAIPLASQQLPPVKAAVPAVSAVITAAQDVPSVSTVAKVNTPVPNELLWFWPVDQPVVEEYNLARRVKGLRFSGQIGDSVRASADGEVVYADDGLQEYGKLVLIKHLNGYISAYAHNSRLLVREKDRVKAGQIIAEMGNSGTDRVMLEFQVRLNGKPVDPRGVLVSSR
jgi:lipoprotein NlpD